MQVFVDGRQVAEIDFADIGRADTPYPFVLMLPQWEIEAILAEDLGRHGVQVEHEVEVTDVRPSASGVAVRATRADGHAAQIAASAYVIGADGAHSVVREIDSVSASTGRPIRKAFSSPIVASSGRSITIT